MSRRRQLGTLAAVCLGQFMILADQTIVNVALPSIQSELGVSQSGLVWVVNAYVLAIASLILVGGSLGDRHGRRRVFLAGLAVFTLGSAACALSGDEPQLIAARAFQGVGAALMAPLSLSILADAFPAERRAWAIGIWASIAGIGFGSGPIIGGALIGAFDWSAIFWINVPVGIAAFVLTRAVVRESRDPAARRLDVPGVLLIASGLFCLTFGFVSTDQHAWDSTIVLAMLAGGVLLIAGFVARQATAREPMLPLEFLRRRSFSIANVVFACLYAGLATTLFYVSLYLQDVQGLTALEVGLVWLVMNVPFLLVSIFAARLQSRLGLTPVVVAGVLMGAAGTFGFTLLDADSPVAAGFPSYLLVGIGYGLAVPAITAVAMTAIETERAGIASGVLNTARQVGAALGLAVFGSIAAAGARDQWADGTGTLPPGQREEADSLTTAVTSGDIAAIADRLGQSAADLADEAFVAGMDWGLRAAAIVILAAAALAMLGARAGVRARARAED